VKFDNITASNVNVASSSTISAVVPAHPVGLVNVTVTNSDGQSGTRSNAFTYTTAPEVTILTDNFDDNSLDTVKWTRNNLFSGFTDAAVPITETSQRLHIGALPLGQSGSHYNGIRSAKTVDFTAAYSYVELVQAPAERNEMCLMPFITRSQTGTGAFGTINQPEMWCSKRQLTMAERREPGHCVTVSDGTSLRYR
jgi:hypothetical protein